MSRPRPNNPQILAAIVAALEAAAQGGGDAFGRMATENMGGADPAVARRLLGKFNRLNEGTRRQALGEYYDHAPQPASTDTSGGAGTGVTTGTMGTERGRGEGGLGGGTRSEGGVTGGGRVFDARILEEILDAHPELLTQYSYAINYAGFVCEAETDWDRWTNSDEVYAITSSVSIAPDGTNIVRTEKHPTDRASYEDVDRNEERIGPVARCWESGTLPVSLSVIAYEHDDGNPDEYRDEIDVLVKAAIAAFIFIYGPAAAVAAIIEGLSGSITDAINWLLDTEDDQVDVPQTVVFSGTQLEELGKRHPSPYIYEQRILNIVRPRVTNLYGHFFTTHSGSGARYTFGFTLERDPAFVVEEGPFL